MNTFGCNITSSKEVTAYVIYLYGQECLQRIERSGPVSTFHLRVPDEDWKIILEEVANPETPICYAPFVDALHNVLAKWSGAKQSGVWQRFKRR